MNTESTKKPPIAKAIELYSQKNGFTIKPDRNLYERLGINQKRFGMLIKGKLEPNYSELLKACQVFGITLSDLA